MKEYQNYSLLRHHTFGMDVRASRFVEYETVEELQQLLPGLNGQPFLHIGGGSNLLFRNDYCGTVLHSGLRGMTYRMDGADVLLRAAAGEVWDDVVAYAVGHGWSGMENLSAIPGEVGASAVQNIGAYGVEAKDLIVTVEAVEVSTGQCCQFTNAECHYGYRQSIFKQEWRGRYIITAVTYRLSSAFIPRLDYGNIRAELERTYGADYEKRLTPEVLRQVVTAIRKAKLPDPAELGNAGSFFMNPVVGRPLFEVLLEDWPDMPYYELDEDRVKLSAGWMIDRCGWKGRTLGRAGVYDRQALILVNHGGATGDEIIALSDAVRADVKMKFGVDIHPEVNIIG